MERVYNYMKLLVLRYFRAQQTDDAEFFEKENATPSLWVYLLIKGVVWPVNCGLIYVLTVWALGTLHRVESRRVLTHPAVFCI